ncbi:hypothetical protein C4D60_Mb08t15320 [Musa balbisiana]|uniref:Uncharacterized protein n=1 Tax=Musa balbisiana TaxID=52838 RepID=A0A4V4H8Y5_MUSBA|nr:hypothetical protein C4D60_Mb08t15320 [Musa balbisiana]
MQPPWGRVSSGRDGGPWPMPKVARYQRGTPRRVMNLRRWGDSQTTDSSTAPRGATGSERTGLLTTPAPLSRDLGPGTSRDDSTEYNSETQRRFSSWADPAGNPPDLGVEAVASIAPRLGSRACRVRRPNDGSHKGIHQRRVRQPPTARLRQPPLGPGGHPPHKPPPQRGASAKRQSVTPRQACLSRMARGATCVQRLDGSGILQFTPVSPLRYVLHRCESGDIRLPRVHQGVTSELYPRAGREAPTTRCSCTLALSTPGLVVHSPPSSHRVRIDIGVLRDEPDEQFVDASRFSGFSRDVAGGETRPVA